MMNRLFGAVVSLMLAIAPASAQTGPTPTSLDGAKVISAAEAKALIDKGGLPMDARTRAAFVDGHLPKAKSIRSAENPQTKMFDPAIFGPSKDAAIVIYGHGIDGWSAVNAVKSAVAAGFTNVNWLRGGFSEWSAAGLPTVQ